MENWEYDMHKSVLLNEILEYLNPKPGENFIDATLNGGGHTEAIAEKVGPAGKVLGIEWDSELLKEFKIKIQKSKFKNSIVVVNDSYANIENIAREYNFRPDGIIFDLGLSSWHYEKSGRGFSFKRDEPLDMRYNAYREVKNKNEKVKTAAEIVNTYNSEDLEKIFREYGEEQFSKQISNSIVSARKEKPILTTNNLVKIISASVPEWYKRRKIHFATKIFQALRITVNDELGNVQKGIQAAINVLKPEGRLVVISFHGGEDKLVREIFKDNVKAGKIEWIKKGTIKPKWEEVKNNPRARSAKMKTARKII